MLFRKYEKWIYIGTALLFVFWKLEHSSALIYAINQLFGLGLGRVLDWTDLFALLVSPISYKCYIISQKSVGGLGNFMKYAFSFLSVFAFFATSQPQIYVEPNWEFNTIYTLPFSKEELLTKEMRYQGIDTLDVNPLDHNEFRIRYDGEFVLVFNATIQEKDSITSELTLNKLLSYTKRGVSSEKKDGLNKQQFLGYFENEVIPLLSRGFVDYPSFTYLIVEP